MNHHRQLIITGMHRSGTSFMGSWMQASGLFIGATLAGATPSNVKGHFEDIEVLEFHERLLKANSTNMYMFEEQSLKFSQEDVTEASEMCRNRNRDHQEWGWKQPRATLFLKLWKTVLPNANYLIPMRHPTAVINSIVRREANKCLLRHDEILGPQLHREYLKNLADHVRRYDGMYAVHCRRLLNLMKEDVDEKCLVVDFQQIEKSESLISSQLEKWGFSFKLIPYDELFETKLLIKEQEFLVADKQISEASKSLYQDLIAHSHRPK